MSVGSVNNYSELPHHPTLTRLVNVLQTRTQNENPLFFQVMVAYYFGVVAATMRTEIEGWSGKGTIPINVYAINLSPSGTGKGHSTHIMEHEVLGMFRETFFNYTFPALSEQTLEKLAHKRATRNNSHISDELTKLQKDFAGLGAPLFSFDSATTPAIKQMRQKLLMAGIGACNLQIDEIGANLEGNIEPLTAYLELYDKGLIKDKLVKSTTENIRFERIDGPTPANLMLFGTPTKLLDGDRVEAKLMELLDMGYGRRCFFGYAKKASKPANRTADTVMAQYFDNDHDEFLQKLSEQFAVLGEAYNANKVVKLSRENARYLIEYQLDCEARSAGLSENNTIRKAELEHRYFKVLKLAGAFAFIDGFHEISKEHLQNAIRLAEDSGKAFAELLVPERAYIKLAKYLAQISEDVTLADLDEDLPSFKGSRSQKEELITMATAWGYKNNIVIRKSFQEGIMFLKGESLQETDLSRMIVSYSSDMTEGYKNDYAPFEKLHKLVELPGMHWLNHHLKGGDVLNSSTNSFSGYRRDDNCVQGFNLLVLDIDGTVQLSTAQMLLKGYKALYYTTKSHTAAENRFRVLLPLNYTLFMSAADYKELINNILQSLPFTVDPTSNQRVKKWLTNPGHYEYTDGEMFDVLPYIPKTSKNAERAQLMQSQQSLDNLERWVLNNTGSGNRNDMLIRYALILVDAGFNLDVVRQKVLDMNTKLPDPLDEGELTSTVLRSAAQAISKRAV